MKNSFVAVLAALVIGAVSMQAQAATRHYSPEVLQKRIAKMEAQLAHAEEVDKKRDANRAKLAQKLQDAKAALAEAQKAAQ